MKLQPKIKYLLFRQKMQFQDIKIKIPLQYELMIVWLIQQIFEFSNYGYNMYNGSLLKHSKECK